MFTPIVFIFAIAAILGLVLIVRMKNRNDKKIMKQSKELRVEIFLPGEPKRDNNKIIYSVISSATCFSSLNDSSDVSRKNDSCLLIRHQTYYCF